MKLVRFELVDQPGLQRSGLIYDERIYETDGEKAIGVHELGKIRLFAPVGPVAGFRVFERTEHGHLTYHHAHPSNIYGPLGELEMPATADGLDFDAHVCAVIQDSGTAIEPSEAEGFVLGYSLALVFRDPNAVDADRAQGGTGALGSDLGAFLGPYLTTPEDLKDSQSETDKSVYVFPYRIKVNGELVDEGVFSADPGIAGLLPIATRLSRTFPSELVAWPRLVKPELEFTTLGRPLLPSDRVAFEVEGLGTLVALVG